jgi:hypothetical protein
MAAHGAQIDALPLVEGEHMQVDVDEQKPLSYVLSTPCTARSFTTLVPHSIEQDVYLVVRNNMGDLTTQPNTLLFILSRLLSAWGIDLFKRVRFVRFALPEIFHAHALRTVVSNPTVLGPISAVSGVRPAPR